VSNKSRRNNRGSSGSRQNRPSGSTNRPQPKVGQPTRSEAPTPSAGLRRRIEIKTGPALIMMHSMPRWILPVGLALSLFLGLILGGSWAWLGAIFLGMITIFLGWLLILSWPMLSISSRLIRLAVVVAVAGVAVFKVFGEWA
jgi:ABC-type multidrug transport system fused ATPase/permease subunit